MGKKKVQDLIKGVVITGTAVGGASVFSDMMGLSVAQTVEASTDEIVVGQNAGEAQEAPSQDSLADSGAAGAGQENASGAGEGAPVAEAQQKAVSEQPAAEAQSNSTATDETTPAAETQKEATTPEQQTEGTTEETNENPAAPTAETPEGPTDEQISESAQTSLSQEGSTLASTSEFQSQSLYTATSELSDNISATENEYADDYELYIEEKEYIEEGIVADSREDVALTKLEDDIDELMDKEEEIREAAGKTLPGTYFSQAGQPLALSMIQYKLTLNGTIGTDYTFVQDSALRNEYGVVSWKVWNTGTNEGSGYNGLYQNHHICLKYVDLDGVYHEEYYDDVTCDKDGKSIIRPVDTWITEEQLRNGEKVTDKPGDEVVTKLVDGINVLKKDPIFDTSKVKRYYTYLGQKIATYQRIGWNTSEEYNYGKGADWYTKTELAEDMQLRSDLLTLPETANSLKGELSEVQNSASASAVASQSASTVRSESLSTSAAASTSASEAKSQAISEKASENASTSTSNSESISSSESTSASIYTSESISSSESASISASLSASESAAIAPAEEVSDVKESAAETNDVATETNDIATETTQTTRNASRASYTVAGVETSYISNVITAEESVVPTDVYSEEMVFAPISNDQVPLAVLEEDLANEDTTYMEQNNMDIVTTIDEDEVAKGVDANGGANVKRWFATTLPVIGTLATLWGKEKLNNTEKNKRK